jgi:hypothetical protein
MTLQIYRRHSVEWQDNGEYEIKKILKGSDGVLTQVLVRNLPKGTRESY